MYIYQLTTSFLIILSSWKCECGEPSIPREIFSSVQEKPAVKHASELNDAKLRLLNSLLQSKSTIDNNNIKENVKKMKTDDKKLKLQSELEDETTKMLSKPSRKSFPSRTEEHMYTSSKSAKTILIEEIMKMTEERAKELANSIVNSKTGTIEMTGQDNLITSKGKDETPSKGNVKAMNTEASDVSKLVSYGYNLIRGCPEGDFDTGGSDPGIMTSKQIFKFTFDQGKVDDRLLPEPDQVDFEPLPATVASSHYVYGGEKSYRDALTTGVLAAGTYRSYQFSASDTVAAVQEEAKKTKTIFWDNKQTLTLGEIRHLHNEDNIQNDITDEFFNDVMSLPVGYFGLTPSDKEAYHNFLDEWGTDIIVRAVVGQKYLTRYRANYSTSFLFLKSSTSLTDSGDVISGAVKINIDKLNGLITSTSQFGSYDKELEIGTADAPVPIKLYLEPITRALDGRFWVSRFGDPLSSATATQQYHSLGRKQSLIDGQLEVYSQLVGATLKDPDISIPIEWPQGTYSLPQTTSGCPAGFSSGCSTQDNEDTNNENLFSFNIDWDMLGQFDDANNDVQTCYCSKTQPGNSIFSWMPGRYCVSRKGGSCPDGFLSGSIKWDDENDGNLNKQFGILPDGVYSNESTLIYFCCRDDGMLEDDILLPNTQPFVLYPYKEPICQEVHGMEFVQHYVYTDDEDSDNKGECMDEVPYVPDDCTGPDIKITYCYYQSSISKNKNYTQ